MSFRLLALALALAPVAAHADQHCDYVDKTHDLVANAFRTVEWTLCEDHFPFGSPAYDDAMAVIDDYNRVQNSAIRMVFAGWEAHTNYWDTRRKNRVNKIDFTEEGCAGTDCSFTGRAKDWRNTWGRIKECDVVLDEGDTWRFGLPAFNQRTLGGAWLRNILSHEIGHCLGLPHTMSSVDDIPNIMGHAMGQWLDEGEATVQMGLKAFDHGHLRHHYSTGEGGRADLLFTNYRLDYSNACVENTSVSDLRPGLGQVIDLRWTRMNKGPVPNDECFHTEIVLTQDHTLGNNDDLLVDRWRVCASVPASSTTFHSRALEIDPSWPVGRYWIAMRIDAEDTVEEADETNNVHFFGQPIVVLSLPDLEAEITNHRIFSLWNWFTGDTFGATLSSVDYQIINSGTSGALATEIVLRREHREVARQGVPALAPGAVHQGAFGSVGEDLWDARIDWEIEVDPGDGVQEIYEDNNLDSFETDYVQPELPEDIDFPADEGPLDPLLPF